MRRDGASAGTVSRKRVPAPTVVEARIRSPPISRASRRDTLRPSPDPPARAAAGLPNSNSSKTRSQASGSMPGPVSSTAIVSTSARHADVDADVALLGELGGVGDQVEDDLADAQLVDQEPLGHVGLDVA